MNARTFLKSLLVATVAVAGLPLAPAAAQEASPKTSATPEHVAGRALVGAKAGGRSHARSAIEARGGKVVSYYAPGNFFIVNTPSAAPEWVASMQSNRAVRYTELDHIVRPDLEADDPYFTNGNLWGLKDSGDNDIDAPEAWDVRTSAANVVVGVIDTGVDYTHEDLDANMWTNTDEIAGNGVDDDGNDWVDDVYGADCVNNDGNPIDDHYHGTHVAGTIAAEGNNATGVVGVAWTAEIMALKFLSSSGSGSTSDAVECLDYARLMGAHMTSNSWGGGGYSQSLRDAIARSESANMLFIAAAGNDGKNSDNSPNYPSGYDNDNIVSVASTTSTDAMSSFSNYGASTVDLGAPGSYIWSTMPGNKYDDLSGTSMATPHVAGAAALAIAEHGTTMPYAKLLDRLYGSVDPLASLAGKTVTGGRLNVAEAIEIETNPHGTPALTVAGSTRTSVSLAWTITATDGDPVRYELSYSPDGISWMPAEPPAATATSATVNGLRPATKYTFRLTAKDNVGNASSATTMADTTAGDVVFADDMEADAAKWSADPPWTRSTQRPHSGSMTWTDSENSVHANKRDISIRTASSFSLANATEPKLTFWHRHNLEPGYDYGYVYVSTDGGSSWTQLARYNGHLDHYKAETIDLGAYAGQSNVKLRFRLYSDRSVVYDGWYVDDVIVSGASSALALTNLQAAPNPFSPGTDDSKDYTRISFDANKTLDSWSLTIADANGTWLCTKSGTGTPSYDWYGGIETDCSGTASANDGTYSVSATAMAGEETASAGSTSVTVDKTAPSGSVTSPTGSNPVSGTIAVESSDAADNAGGTGLEKVEFFIDGGLIGTDSNGSDGWSVSWNTATVANGNHALTAKTTDLAGNSSTSTGVTVNVENTTPPLSVSVAEGSERKKGPWHHQDVVVSISDGSAPVSGATVDFKVYAGACPPSGESTPIHSEVVTLTTSDHTFTFKTRTPESYCAVAVATKSGYNAGKGSATVTVGS